MPPRKGPWHNARADRRYRALTRLLPHRPTPATQPVRRPNPAPAPGDHGVVVGFEPGSALNPMIDEGNRR